MKPDANDAALPGQSLFSIASGAAPDCSVLSEYHASASICGTFMIRRGRYKYIHYIGHAPMLFDMERDPFERTDLAVDPNQRQTLADCEAELRRILDPEAVDRLARSDQNAMIERVGGRDLILKRGAITYSPPPGVAPDLTSVESAGRA